MDLTLLAVAGGWIVAAVLLVVLLRRRSPPPAHPGEGAPSHRSVWVTPPVPDAPPGETIAPPSKAAPGVIGLEDLPAPAKRRPAGPWLGWGLALMVVVVAVAVWNAGYLSSLVGGAAAPEPGFWPSAGVETAGGEAGPVPREGTTEVVDAVEPVVAYDAESGLRLIAWSGNGQAGLPGRPLGRALAVVVRDSADRPLPGVEVHFVVAGGGGRLDPAVAVTGDLGLATASWWLGVDPDSLRVQAFLATTPALRVEFEAAFEDGARAPRVASAEPADGGADGGTDAAAEAPPPAPEPRRADAGPEPAATPAQATATAPDRGAREGVTETRPAPPTGPPGRVSAGPRARSPVAAGGIHTCRAAGSRGLVCFGGDQAGGGRVVSGPSLRAVRTGVFHSCGITAQGTVYCWPARSADQPTAAAPRADVTLPDGATPVDVAAGSEHSCALTADGAVYCWGVNTHGQLGNGGTSDTRSPARVQDLPPVVQLVAGWLHTCALTGEGRAYCWGANTRAQVGDGSTTDRSRATPVAQAAGFTAITAGSAHTCGLTPAGQAWCWGANEHGQLGTGPGRQESAPRRVAADQRFTALSAGGVHTCGLTGAGQAWCWGRNTFGQLGDGTTRDARLPSRVAGDHRLLALEAGGAHTCAEAAGGRVYCWGNNMQGQVGDGTRENRSSPVLMMQEDG